jgi:hypothetical protein
MEPKDDAPEGAVPESAQAARKRKSRNEKRVQAPGLPDPAAPGDAQDPDGGTQVRVASIMQRGTVGVAIVGGLAGIIIAVLPKNAEQQSPTGRSSPPDVSSQIAANHAQARHVSARLDDYQTRLSHLERRAADPITALPEAFDAAIAISILKGEIASLIRVTPSDNEQHSILRKMMETCDSVLTKLRAIVYASTSSATITERAPGDNDSANTNGVRSAVVVDTVYDQISYEMLSALSRSVTQVDLCCCAPKGRSAEFYVVVRGLPSNVSLDVVGVTVTGPLSSPYDPKFSNPPSDCYIVFEGLLETVWSTNRRISGHASTYATGAFAQAALPTLFQSYAYLGADGNFANNGKWSTLVLSFILRSGQTKGPRSRLTFSPNRHSAVIPQGDKCIWTWMQDG